MTEKNTCRKPSRAAWPLGLLLSTGMLLLVWLFCTMRYATNDDTLVLRQMMGFGVTELPNFNLYIHFLLFYPLRWLSLLFPGQPIFSWMQLFLIWLAAAVLSKSILQCFRNANKPLWLGLIAAVLFLMVFVWRYMSQVSYTVTAALLGAAAVLQLMSIHTEAATNRQWILSALGALVLAVLGYAMRQMTALPSVAFCGIAFVVQGMRRLHTGRDWKKPLLCTLLVVAVVFGLLCGLREIEIAAKPGASDYVAWQKQRIRIWDYHDLNDTPQETREQYGLTDAKVALLADWYLMDSAMDTETLRAIGDALEAAQDGSLTARLGKALDTLGAFPANEPLAAKSLPVLAALWVLCLAGLLLGRGGKRTGQWLGLCLDPLLFAALCLYLGMQGRLPMRGLLTAALPFAALLAGLLPACLPMKSSVPAKAALSLLAAAAVVLCCLYLKPLWQEIGKKPLTEEEQMAQDTLAALDDYAVCNEECLLVVDNTLVGDMRMFPTTEYGISKNLVYWGGWNLHSPSYNELLSRYGFDADTWSLENFLSYDVRLVRGMLEPPPQLLLDALGELVEVDYYLDSEWDGVFSMYFEKW